jgi:16S rRNA (uracil1498-N3)-methyltransferase
VSLAPHLHVDVPLADLGPPVTVPIVAATLHHLRRVLRLADGAALRVTDGAGHIADAALDGDAARLVGPVLRVAAPAPRLVLAQAVSKGRRAEDAVRVACELGVDRIVPVVAARTQGRPDARAAETLVERWRAVAVAALEQSRGVHLAAVSSPVASHALLAPSGGGTGEASPAALRLIAVPGADPLPTVLTSVSRDGAAPTEVLVAVGPEGGWTDEEVDAAVTSGWLAVGLGATVLRTEHAGPVAVAVAAALSGRWDTATLGIHPARSTDAL